jgi:23S rRNA (uracil1939-C5)-methyltransferase
MTEALLLIEDMGRRGEGIARRDGRAVFVPGALPGETVRAAGSGDRLALTEIVTPSPERVPAFCEYFGRCGGCQLQHWREEPYRAWKKNLVAEALAARGIAATVGTLIDAHGAGRRRLSLHVRCRDGKAMVGFMEARSHRLLDMGACPILVPELQRAFAIGRAIAARLGDGDVAVTATATGLDVSVKAARKIAERQHPALAELVRELRIARLSVNGEVIATATPPRLVMGRADVMIPPGAFLQATSLGEETLSRLVIDAAGTAKTVADLFCGVGPFALRLAAKARIAAYDSDRAAIAALDAAARATAGLKPVVAAARDLFREPLVPGELKDFDAVIFDPPRPGAEAQARQLARSAVATVVAVSCDAASFARDAEILISGGYALKRLDAVDQFKWSAHVEIVAAFQRPR